MYTREMRPGDGSSTFFHFVNLKINSYFIGLDHGAHNLLFYISVS